MENLSIENFDYNVVVEQNAMTRDRLVAFSKKLKAFLLKKYFKLPFILFQNNISQIDEEMSIVTSNFVKENKILIDVDIVFKPIFGYLEGKNYICLTDIVLVIK